eukprot:TRINITY_DN16691_c0_g1_i1.p1 TRINITY_DN16691_c0_g1~~TRINITY_DN16691_c0_g1_i1.p1  ORF type:complete len:611 (-),score=160.63 TRINITY_DN16691_c0_g1_i1:98-1930(-)
MAEAKPTFVPAPPSDCPPLQVIAHSSEGIQGYWGPPGDLKEDNNIHINGGKIAYSRDGKYLTVNEASGLSILDAGTGKEISKLAQAGIFQISFSPLSTYLLTIHRFNKEKAQEGNLVLWNVATAEVVARFAQKNFSRDTWPNIQFSSDEKISARAVSNEIQFFDGASGLKTNRVVKRIYLEGVTQFSISPSAAPYTISAFYPEKKGSPGSLKVYQYPALDTVLATKSFFNADSCNVLWNPSGTHAIVETNCEVDKTGQSYYGQTNVFLVSADGKINEKVDLQKNGPVYQCSWNPKGTQFLVIHGFMPAKSTLYALDGKPIADFGSGSRNTAIWSPNGRVLCIGGFGNLQGEMDFWNPQKVKKLGMASAPMSAHQEWSPCGNYLLTAVLSPRMRVDNGYKIINYYGHEVTKCPVKELFSMVWRPAPSGTYPDRSPKPPVGGYMDATAPAPEKKAAYRHPNAARSSAKKDVCARVEEVAKKYSSQRTQGAAAGKFGGTAVLGAGPPPSKASQKNKSRRRKKKPTDGAEAADGTDEKNSGGAGTAAAVAAAAATVATPAATDPAKKAKTIEKKLRQIDALREKQKGGAQLNEAQKTKLNTEAALRKELENLEV